MLQTRSMTPSLIYKVKFSPRIIIQISVCQTKQCTRCLRSHLNRIYNGNPQKCRGFIIIHPQISKRVIAKIILVSPASILVGEWLQGQQHFWAWSLYVLSRWDVRHSLDCLVLTDTYLYNITKGQNLPCKSNMVPYYVFATSMLWRRLLPLVLYYW